MAVTYQIRLQKWVTSKDANGDHVEAVTKNISTFAEVTDGGGSRSFDFGDTNMTKNKDFKIRFNINFDPTGNWRVIYDGKQYTINSIEKDKEKRFYWVLKGTAE